MYISDCIRALLSFTNIMAAPASYRTRSVTRQRWTTEEASLVRAHQLDYAHDQDNAPYAYLWKEVQGGPWSSMSPLLVEKEDESFAFAPDAPAELLLCHALLDRVNQPDFKEPAAFAPLTIVGLGEELLSDLPPMSTSEAAALCSDAPWDADSCCVADDWVAFFDILAPSH